MQKLTLTVSESFYKALYATIGKRNISRFVEENLTPLISGDYLEQGYKAMAADEAREKEALEWSEAAISGTDIGSDENF